MPLIKSQFSHVRLQLVEKHLAHESLTKNTAYCVRQRGVIFFKNAKKKQINY